MSYKTQFLLNSVRAPIQSNLPPLRLHGERLAKHGSVMHINFVYDHDQDYRILACCHLLQKHTQIHALYEHEANLTIFTKCPVFNDNNRLITDLEIEDVDGGREQESIDDWNVDQFVPTTTGWVRVKNFGLDEYVDVDYKKLNKHADLRRKLKNITVHGVGNYDCFSAMTLPKLQSLLPIEIFDLFKDLQGDSIAYACRWVMRGLHPKLARLKALMRFDTYKKQIRPVSAPKPKPKVYKEIDFSYLD